MKFEFIGEHCGDFAVTRMCDVLDVSTSGYYAWRDRPPSQRDRENQDLLARIREIHEASRRTYGSPRIHAELREQGIKCNIKRVERLMRKNDIRAKQVKRYRTTTDSDHSMPVAPNRLDQDFDVEAPNTTWLSDITYIATDEGWLYLAIVMDLYSRRIVGWAMDTTLASSLTKRALTMAITQRRPAAGLLHHSDRGSQYASSDYQALLEDCDMIPSMSRTGNCYDNAPMESFIGTLKTELVHDRHYVTRSEARTDIFDYIERFYNRTRRHSALDFQSPIEFERLQPICLN